MGELEVVRPFKVDGRTYEVGDAFNLDDHPDRDDVLHHCTSACPDRDEHLKRLDA